MRSGLVIVVVVLLATQAGMGIGTAVGSTNIDSTAVCTTLDPDQLTVAVTTPIDQPEVVQNTTFFGGSTVTVVLCSSTGDVIPPRGGDEWSISSGSGIENTEIQAESIMVTLSNQETTVDLPERITEKDREVGPRLRVTTGAVVESELQGIDRISFPNESLASTYRSAESEALAASAAIRENVSRLNEAAATIEQDGIGSTDAPTRVRAIATARQRLKNASASARMSLYRATYAGQNTTNALIQLEDVRAAATATAKTGKTTYRDALRQRRAKVTGNIHETVLLSILPGIVLGLVAGAIGPYRRGRKVDRLRTRTASATYDRNVIRIPLLVAVGAILLGTAILVITGATGAFLP